MLLNDCIFKFWKKNFKHFSNQYSYLLFCLPASLIAIWALRITFDSVSNFISFLDPKR